MNTASKSQYGGAASRHDGRAWCRRFGMSASSWDAWAQLHVNPSVAIGYFFCSHVLYSSSSAYICTGVRGEGPMYFVVLIPFVFNTVGNVAIIVLFWRWGPTVAHHKVYQPVLAILGLCTMTLVYVAFIGPAATVPWNDRFHSDTAVYFGTFWQLQAGVAGFLPGEHPAEPRTSIREPFLRSALQALMAIDALTDLELSKSLMAAVCPH